MSKVSLQNAAGSHRHASLEQYERSTADLYTTPADAVLRLYKARPALRGMLAWDSSAGLGHIVAAIHAAGGRATGTELHDHPFPKLAEITTGIDALTVEQPHGDIAIINPPYNQADRHIRHMMALGLDTWALLRFNWICAKKRADLLHSLRETLLVGRMHMPPPGAVDQGMSPSIDYAWFRFSPRVRAHAGIQIERA